MTSQGRPTPRQTLDGFWKTVEGLKADSSSEEFQKIGQFAVDDAVFYLSGMASPPSKGRDELVAGLKVLTTYWSMVEQRVLSRSKSDDGKILVTEMDNKITFLGEVVENFPETEVVEFNDEGLIVSYRLYCDGGALRDIAAKKGAGAGQ